MKSDSNRPHKANRLPTTKKLLFAILFVLCFGWLAGLALLRPDFLQNENQALLPHRKLHSIPIRNKIELPLIIIVVSSTHQYDMRQAIRHTWGNRTILKAMLGNNVIGPLFFVGTTEVSEKGLTESNEEAIGSNDWQMRFMIDIEKRLQVETEQYGDVVRVPVRDEFRNLTPKMLQIYRFIAKKYNAQLEDWRDLHIVKVDDDAYIDIPAIASYFHREMTAPLDVFYCFMFENARVIRDKTSKLFVGPEAYASEHYPTFCSGMAYIFRGEMLAQMLEQSEKLAPLPMEDTYYTGTIAEAIGAQHIRMPYVEPFYEAGQLNDAELCTKIRFVLHRLTAQQMFKMYQCSKFDNLISF